MSEKPEALRLIQHMDDNYPDDWDGIAIRAELRRQHAEIERLKAALPYDWDQLEACRGSLREYMAEIRRLRELLAEARSYLPQHHPPEILFSRINQALNQALQEDKT